MGNANGERSLREGIGRGLHNTKNQPDGWQCDACLCFPQPAARAFPCATGAQARWVAHVEPDPGAVAASPAPTGRARDSNGGDGHGAPPQLTPRRPRVHQACSDHKTRQAGAHPPRWTWPHLQIATPSAKRCLNVLATKESLELIVRKN